MSEQELHLKTLEDYREMGRLQGREQIRKILEETVLAHLKRMQTEKHSSQYAQGYIAGLEYCIRTLEIKS